MKPCSVAIILLKFWVQHKQFSIFGGVIGTISLGLRMGMAQEHTHRYINSSSGDGGSGGGGGGSTKSSKK